MTGFLLLALAASLVLLVLEGAWLVRVPKTKYKTVIRRSIYVGAGLVVLGFVYVYNWHWWWGLMGIALMFGEIAQLRLLGDKSTGRPPAEFVTHITRRFQTSFASAGPNGSQDRGPSQQAIRQQGMSREQARRVLGLNPNATEQDVKDAHRRLMRRVHPDKGGTAQQAALINRAKDILLEE